MILFQDTLLTNNRALDAGGGVYMLGGTLAISDSHIDDNWLLNPGDGAGLNIQRSANVLISGTSSIDANSGYRRVSGAAYIGRVHYIRGLGIYNEGSLSSSGDFSLSQNSSFVFGGVEGGSYSSDGGALYNDGSASLTGATIDQNGNTLFGTKHGGAVYNSPLGQLSIRDSSLRYNFSGYSRGGALHNDNGIVHLENVDVEHNVASNSAGAILNDGIDAGITVVRSRISENSAYDAAGILNLSGDVRVIGSTFNRNYSIVASGSLGANAISHRGENKFSSSEAIRLVVLTAMVDDVQTEFYVNDVDTLNRFPLPLNIQIENERLTILELDKFKSSIKVKREEGTRHAVSSVVQTFLDDRQRYLAVADSTQFEKYRLPFDILVHEEVMTVTEINGDILSIQRGRNDTAPATHYYPFTVWAVSGSLSVDSSIFSENASTTAATGAVYSMVHPFVRKSIIENSTFVGNSSVSEGADVRTETARRRPENETVNEIASHDINDPTLFPYWNYKPRASIYIENSIFSRATSATGIPTSNINGLVQSGGSNFVEQSDLAEFALGARIEPDETQIVLPFSKDFPATPFSIVLGHVQENSWIREFAIVTQLSLADADKNTTLTITRGANDSQPVAHPIGTLLGFSDQGLHQVTDRVGSRDGDVTLGYRTKLDSPNGLQSTTTSFAVQDPSNFPSVPFAARIVSNTAMSVAVVEDVEVTAVNDYTITVSRGKNNTLAVAHTDNAVLEFYVSNAVRVRLDARIGAWPRSNPDGIPATPLPDSPLLDRGNVESVRGFSGLITSSLGSEYQSVAILNFSVGATVPTVSLTGFAYLDQPWLSVNTVLGLPAVPFLLRVGDELMDVTVVNLQEKKLFVTRAAYHSIAKNYEPGQKVYFGLPMSSAPQDTTLLVQDASHLPQPPFYIAAGTEIVRVDNVDTLRNTITVTRGALGTQIASHPVDTTFEDSYQDTGHVALNFAVAGQVELKTVEASKTELLVKAVDANATELFFADLPEFPAAGILGRTIQAGGERMFVTALSKKSEQSTYARVWVTRGYQNTTAAAIPKSTPITFNGLLYSVDPSFTTPSLPFYVRIGDEVLTIENTRTLGQLQLTAANSETASQRILVVSNIQSNSTSKPSFTGNQQITVAYGSDILASTGTMQLNVSKTVSAHHDRGQISAARA